MIIIDNATLALFRGPGRCEWCKRMVSRREPHHIIPRGMGGGSRMDHSWNLVALCGVFTGGLNCHLEVTAGRIPQCSMFAVVAQREGRLQDEIEGELKRILALPKPNRKFRRSG